VLDANGGEVSRSSVVLAQPYHLSYPFVFQHGDDFFMVPETHATATIQLFRAVQFPWQWRLDRILLRDVVAFDPTIVRHEGRMYLFATVPAKGRWGAWDQLCIYHADSLTGKWRPHSVNPVMADVRRARPAGRVFVEGGDLWRPAQDCSPRYGTRVVFHRIGVLNGDQYEEERIHTLEPTGLPGALRTHCYDRNATYEVVDVLRGLPRFPFAPPLRS
jgi:hypothetical protein